MTRNVFLIGLNDFNLQKLRTIRNAENYNFHGIIDPAAILETEHFPMKQLIETAEAELRAFDGSIDAIAVYMDFPVSTMWPILCRKFGLPSPTLESLLKCEHKYWSRVEQKRVIPEHIPQFATFNPHDGDPLKDIPFDFPFWVKPIKSSGSRLGFRINNEQDFAEAVRILRNNIELIADPFNYVLEQAELPSEISAIDGHYCLAEQIIGGRQCTLEGYVFEGEPRIYGVVDSIRHENKVSFLRYQYPSRLPVEVRRRMVRIAKKVMRHMGFDNSAFNIEFFWDQKKDHLWLLEINTRLSQSHCDLFEKIDGRSNHEIAVDIALGNKPDYPRRQGPFKVAAKFFHRKFQDAVVTRVPTDAEIRSIEARFPGTIIKPQVKEGMRLSELPEQDSYSFAVAYIFMGAKNQKQLLRNYRKCRKALGFQYEPIQTETPDVSFARIA
ncbi:MAG: ATP-grasp domain-containing protein [Gammaproteobacteria bacterium]|nr:ATP-grasp domain-containing protein [Gammaproteobacteria bacterium]NIR83730.1 ATP-grasp domain-containing protein [Gammaproteobacteria bacterium]NIR91877.1 ATP-grasp domain-containing protein [Gammaproteobacteria bacterium]NIU04896.1 ATP-grasp domain-containing protein [Gammaproteobacteria bacterium]NIV51878.1 ATP-grasp domain-containing protein [Gammaproteobacteria bacterium]